MSQLRTVFLFVLILVAPSILSAQQGSSPDAGSNVYSFDNAEYGFAFDFPRGWQRASDNLLEQLRNGSPEPTRTEPLLMLVADGTASPKGTVIEIQAISIQGVKGTDMDVGERYLQALFKHSKSTTAPEKVDFGGAGFYRVNGELPGSSQGAYYAVFASARRGRILVAEVRGDTERARDDATSLLITEIHFTPDWTLPSSDLDVDPQHHVHIGGPVPSEEEKKQQAAR